LNQLFITSQAEVVTSKAGKDYELTNVAVTKADGEKLITVSSFTSGAIKKNKTELLMSIPYKQKKELDYSASVSKYGDYLLIPVTCMDYNDTTYGWRGKLISINWYVADMNGKVLAQFK